MKVALITGITGQDGSYLAEFLLKKNYTVHGIIRKSTAVNYKNIETINTKIHLHEMDLTSGIRFYNLIEKIKPDEIYNLGAQSFVPTSWDLPIYTHRVNGEAVLSCLDAIVRLNPQIKYYQASTSEMFGNSGRSTSYGQNEETPFNPLSPYAASKLYAHNLVEMYRSKYGLFAVSGILFNHESPKRGIEFVTRKISHAVAQIKLGYLNKLHLGNLTPRRDWGFAGDYVEAMWMMMQHKKADTFVIGTGETHPIYKFVELAFNYVDLVPKDFVVTTATLKRQNEVNYLKADFRKAKEILGWSPTVNFKELVEMMVERDIWNVKHGIIEKL